MNAKSDKRIMSDIDQLVKSEDELKSLGIFWWVDPDNIYEWRFAICGTKGTPYRYGYHLFSMNIPNTYPLQYPSMKYLTTDGVTRFNPNLYVQGKVCLSIFGTWQGPGWTPIYTIKSILLILKATVLNEEPLRNEPGYETAPESIVKAYSDHIRYKNLEVALCNQLTNFPKSCAGVEDAVRAHFRKNKKRILSYVRRLAKNHNGVTLHEGAYEMRPVTTDYCGLLARIESLEV